MEKKQTHRTGDSLLLQRLPARVSTGSHLPHSAAHFPRVYRNAGAANKVDAVDEAQPIGTVPLLVRHHAGSLPHRLLLPEGGRKRDPHVHPQ